MKLARQSVQAILERFSIQSSECEITDLGNHGGFSGANLWRIKTPDSNELCLRCFPPHPSSLDQVKRQTWIHSVLNAVADEGKLHPILPLPRRTVEGRSILEYSGQPFELTPWLPGDADFSNRPTEARIDSVAKCLARFHISSRPLGQIPCQVSELRGIRQREQLIGQFNRGLLTQIEMTLPRFPSPELALMVTQCYRALESNLSRRMATIGQKKVFRQICIRDIWHDHVFFCQSDVSGIVDFGAMDWDHPATDISRLFGSLFQNSEDMWATGLRAYRTNCELSDLELELIEVYDRTTTMLAGMNWLKWILVENRKFDSFVPIKQRMDLLVQRMQDWV